MTTYTQTGLVQALLPSSCICCAAIAHSLLDGSCHFRHPEISVLSRQKLTLNLTLFLSHQSRNEHSAMSCAAIYPRHVQFEQVSIGSFVHRDLWLPSFSETSKWMPKHLNGTPQTQSRCGYNLEQKHCEPKEHMDIFHTRKHHPTQGNRKSSSAPRKEKNIQSGKYTKNEKKY